MAARRTAIIVDDMKTMREMLRTWLTDAGFFVIECASADDALQRLITITPNVILLDVNMPEIDGYELCSIIRRDYQHIRCPILFVTTNRTREDLQTAKQVGGDYFVVKPFTQETLLTGIKKAAVARRRSASF